MGIGAHHLQHVLSRGLDALRQALLSQAVDRDDLEISVGKPAAQGSDFGIWGSMVYDLWSMVEGYILVK
jgi:hypothetical protein